MVFLTVVYEYAKNQKNTGHFVVISISATYGEMAAKFSKNNLSLLFFLLDMLSEKEYFPKILFLNFGVK